MAAKLNSIAPCVKICTFVRIVPPPLIQVGVPDSWDLWLTQYPSGEAEEAPQLALLGGL